MPVKPGENEEEYFAKQELERRRQQESENQARMQEEERQRLKDLHFMHCPKCGMKLAEIDYKGVKVDECSACRGIWLDAGELETVSQMEKGAVDKLLGLFTGSD